MYLSELLIDVGLDPDRPRPGRLWLRNVYHVHQRICMAFPAAARADSDPDFLAPYDPMDFPEQRHLADACKCTVSQDMLRQVHARRSADSGVLFRIDPQTGGREVILVQSAVEPDWDYAFHNADYLLAAPAACRSHAPRFAVGEAYRFRLSANPTRKIDTRTGADGNRRHGRRVPVRHDGLDSWLDRKAAVAGFAVDWDATSIASGYVYFSKTREGRGQATATSEPPREERPQKGRLFSVRFDGRLTVTDPASLLAAVEAGLGPAKAFGCGLLSLARP